MIKLPETCVLYPPTAPETHTANALTDEQFDMIMEEGFKQAKAGQGISVDEAFAQIRESI